MIAFSDSQTAAIRHIQTAPGGAGVADVSKVRFDGSLKAAAGQDAVVVLNGDITTGVQPGTAFIARGTRFHNMRVVTSPMMYLRGAGLFVIEECAFTGVVPEYMALLVDHQRAIVRANSGLTYPLGAGNGRVNISAITSVAQIIYDGDKTVDTGPSELFSSTAPTYTHLAPGSIARIPGGKDGEGYTAHILTASGWERTWQVEVTP